MLKLLTILLTVPIIGSATTITAISIRDAKVTKNPNPGNENIDEVKLERPVVPYTMDYKTIVASWHQSNGEASLETNSFATAMTEIKGELYFALSDNTIWKETSKEEMIQLAKSFSTVTAIFEFNNKIHYVSDSAICSLEDGHTKTTYTGKTDIQGKTKISFIGVNDQLEINKPEIGYYRQTPLALFWDHSAKKVISYNFIGEVISFFWLPPWIFL